MKRLLKPKSSNRESGASLVEYALACALIAISLFSIGTAFMGDVGASMSKTGSMLQGKATLACSGDGGSGCVEE